MNFAESRILFNVTLTVGRDHKTVRSITDYAIERLVAASLQRVAKFKFDLKRVAKSKANIRLRMLSLRSRKFSVRSNGFRLS